MSLSQKVRKANDEVDRALETLPIASAQKKGGLVRDAQRDIRILSSSLTLTEKRLEKLDRTMKSAGYDREELRRAMVKGATAAKEKLVAYCNRNANDPYDQFRDDLRTYAYKSQFREDSDTMSVPIQDFRKAREKLFRDMDQLADEERRLSGKAARSTSPHYIDMTSWKAGQMTGARNVQEQYDKIEEIKGAVSDDVKSISALSGEVIAAVEKLSEAYAIAKLAAATRTRMGKDALNDPKEAAIELIRNADVADYMPRFDYATSGTDSGNSGRPSTIGFVDTNASAPKNDVRELGGAYGTNAAPDTGSQMHERSSSGQRVSNAWIREAEKYYNDAFISWARLSKGEMDEYESMFAELKRTRSADTASKIWKKVNTKWLDLTDTIPAASKKSFQELIDSGATMDEMRGASRVMLSAHITHYRRELMVIIGGADGEKLDGLMTKGDNIMYDAAEAADEVERKRLQALAEKNMADVGDLLKKVHVDLAAFHGNYRNMRVLTSSGTFKGEDLLWDHMYRLAYNAYKRRKLGDVDSNINMPPPMPYFGTGGDAEKTGDRTGQSPYSVDLPPIQAPSTVGTDDAGEATRIVDLDNPDKAGSQGTRGVDTPPPPPGPFE